MHLINAADLSPGHAGCRQYPPSWPGLGMVEGLVQEGLQWGALGGWGLQTTSRVVREVSASDPAACRGATGQPAPGGDPSVSLGAFFPFQISPG